MGIQIKSKRCVGLRTDLQALYANSGKRYQASTARGFTLIELVLALAVMSLAVTLLLSLFFRSMDIGDTLRNRSLAANLAETQLSAIQSMPKQYTWHFPEDSDPDALEADSLVPVTPKEAGVEPGEGVAWQAPSVLPPVETLAQSQQARYEAFRWRAFAGAPQAANLPEATAREYHYLELTVEVAWEEDGRPQQLLYTTAVPLSQVEGADV